jgi:hypothetical protein
LVPESLADATALSGVQGFVRACAGSRLTVAFELSMTSLRAFNALLARSGLNSSSLLLAAFERPREHKISLCLGAVVLMVAAPFLTFPEVRAFAACSKFTLFHGMGQEFERGFLRCAGPAAMVNLAIDQLRLGSPTAVVLLKPHQRDKVKWMFQRELRSSQPDPACVHVATTDGSILYTDSTTRALTRTPEMHASLVGGLDFNPRGLRDAIFCFTLLRLPRRILCRNRKNGLGPRPDIPLPRRTHPPNAV